MNSISETQHHFMSSNELATVIFILHGNGGYNLTFNLITYTMLRGETPRALTSIPPGLHCVSYLSKEIGKETNASQRVSNWFFLESKEVKVFQLNQSRYCRNNVLIELKNEEKGPIVDDYYRMKFRGVTYGYDAQEKKIRHSFHQKWVELVKEISLENLKRWQPVCGRIEGKGELGLTRREKKILGIDVNKFSDLEDDIHLGSELEQGLFKENRFCQYTKIPKFIKDPTLSPQEVTMMNFDKTFLVRRVLDENNMKLTSFLQELQFTFVMFLVGHCYDALIQWKKIIEVLCQCDLMIKKESKFYQRFVTIWTKQLEVIEDDEIFENDGENFIHVYVRYLIELCSDIPDMDLKSLHKIVKKWGISLAD